MLYHPLLSQTFSNISPLLLIELSFPGIIMTTIIMHPFYYKTNPSTLAPDISFAVYLSRVFSPLPEPMSKTSNTQKIQKLLQAPSYINCKKMNVTFHPSYP